MKNNYRSVRQSTGTRCAGAAARACLDLETDRSPFELQFSRYLYPHDNCAGDPSTHINIIDIVDVDPLLLCYSHWVPSSHCYSPSATAMVRDINLNTPPEIVIERRK